MELHPASPSLFEAYRTNSAADGPDASVSETRPLCDTPVKLTRRPPAFGMDEVLIPDDRASLSPAQLVERKLSLLLRGGTVPVSHLRMNRLCRRA
jgi:hypothetical protein